MNRSKTIVMAGGDARSVIAAGCLAEEGYRMLLLGFDKYRGEVGDTARARLPERVLPEADAVVLPLPYTRDGETVFAPFSEEPMLLESVFRFCAGKPLLGGMLPDGERGRFDYCDETMALQNADVTAEAAVSLAMQKLSRTLNGAEALIAGYGRIGKALAGKLKGLGCKVTVIARKEKDRALIRLSGSKASDYPPDGQTLSSADMIFNTVPAEVLPQARTDGLPGRIPVIDLADSLHGKRVVSARGLPGSYAPETAGRILADAIARTIGKEGLL